MNRGSDKHRLLVENLPDAYAYYQVVTDDNGSPVDCIFLEVNGAFEVMTGLKRKEIIGKKGTEALFGTEMSESDWICTCGQVALSGEPFRFEHYFKSSERWYDVCAYSDEPGYFAVVFRDITVQKLNESNLQRSENSYKYLTNNIPEMVVHFDTELRHIYGNQVVEKTLGIPADFFKGKTFLDLQEWSISEEQANQLQTMHDTLQRCLQSGEEQRFYDSFTLPEGEKHLLTRIVPEKGKDGQIVALLAVTTDITEHKQAEKALRESEEKHRRLFETMTQGVIHQAADGKVISANPAAEKILGLAFDQMQGKTSMDPRWQMIEEDGTPVPGTDHPAMIALRTGQTVGPVTRGVFHPVKNSHVWLKITAIPLFQPGEKMPFQAYATFDDITDRKRAEAALRLTQFSVDEAADGILWVGPDASIRYVNKQLCRLLGYSQDELLGMKIFDFDLIFGPEDWPKRWSSLRMKDSIVVESKYRRKDGAILPVEISANYIRFEGEEYNFAFVRDITERKQAEEALKHQASERAAVDAFTYSVSNDLQAPLRRIEGFSEALLEECPEQLNAQARSYLNRIVNQIDSMKKINFALLKLSRVVSREISREAVDLGALFRSNLKKLQLQEPERQVETVVAPQLTVEGDAELLKILMDNLLDNAWKYTTGAEDALIEFGSTEQDGRTVYYLKDNGVGFDMNYADKLFIPFHKLHGEGEYPGIGIGLNLVYRIISRHGGEVWAEGEEGKGACIYFTLP